MESQKQSAAHNSWAAPRDDFFARQPFPGAEYGPYRDEDNDADTDSSTTSSWDRVMTPSSSAPETLHITPRLNSVRQMTDNRQAPFDMEFLFGPRKSHEVVPGAEWEAALHVLTPDVAALMLKGFHWDESNVPREGRSGGISSQELVWEATVDNPYFGSGAVGGAYHLNGWPLARHYHLQSKVGRQNPKWTAILRVRAREQSTLCQFRICNLSPANCYSVRAWAKPRRARENEYRCVVYHYDSERPQDNCNTFFDDMPLEGWWPWPKAAAKSQSTKDNSKKDSKSPEQEVEDSLCRRARQQGVRVLRVGSPSAFNNNDHDVGRRYVTVHGVDVRSYMVLAIFVILLGSGIFSIVTEFRAINSKLRSTAEPQSTSEHDTIVHDKIQYWSATEDDNSMYSWSRIEPQDRSRIEPQDPIEPKVMTEPADDDLPVDFADERDYIQVMRMSERPPWKFVKNHEPPKAKAPKVLKVPIEPEAPSVPPYIWTWFVDAEHEVPEL